MSRIVHIANMYSPVSGGLRTAIHALGESYLALGQDFVVVVPGKRFRKTRTSYGIKYEIPSIPIPGTGGYRIILRLRMVKRILQQYSPTVLEISDRLTLLPLAKWAQKEGIQTVLFAHERVDGVLRAFTLKLVPVEKIADLWNRISAKWITHLVATTKYAAAEYERIDLNPNIISLGVDLTRFSPNLRELDVKLKFEISGEFVFAMTRLSREKDPYLLIEIARELKLTGSSAQILVAGQGPVFRSLVKTSELENLPIRFLGHIADRSHIAKLLASADVFLAAGPIETFGLAALESLASGVPVICRDSGAIQEIIDESCGSVLQRDPKIWITEINEWVKRDYTIKSSSSRQRAEKFSWHTCANELLLRYGVINTEAKAA